jgi:hypothetical protein
MRSIVSTRVKIYGEGEWLDQKHGIPLAPTLAQAASRLRRRYAGNRRGGTADDVGDVSALPDLLDQIEHPIGSVTADGAYDGDPVYDEVLQRHPTARVIIPPRARAVLSEAGTTQRDEHLRSIEAHGRIGWQHRVGYGKRSLVETAMYRYQTIIGRRLHPSSGYSTGRPPLVSNETGS